MPLDSRDARQWLQFDDAETTAENAWFSRPNPVACDIRWSEDPDSHVWQGQLVRVEAFDPETRTLTVVVRIDGNQFHSQDAERLPLVDGMFCSVDIPGRTLQGVYSVPRWAVSYEGDIYIAKDNRLEIRRVKVLRQQGNTAIFADGVQPVRHRDQRRQPHRGGRQSITLLCVGHPPHLGKHQPWRPRSR